MLGYMEAAKEFFFRNSAVDMDLFIASISGEERCYRVWNMLNERDMTVNQKIIFYFEEVIRSLESGGEQKYDELFNVNEKEKMHSILYDEISGLAALEECLNLDDRDISNSKILLDISTMTKPYFFIIIQYLINEKKCTSLHLAYTEPQSYYQLQEGGYLFTRGTSRSSNIPAYSGMKDVSKKTALVILLGFEGERSSEVVRSVDPDVTIPVNGFPAYMPKFKDISLLQNEEILKEPETLYNLRYAPAKDPFETKIVLEEIYAEYRDHYNICISPLGTKPMALGACLFALKHPDVSVIYPYPREYNFKSSERYSDTWIYHVEII